MAIRIVVNESARRLLDWGSCLMVIGAGLAMGQLHVSLLVWVAYLTGCLGALIMGALPEPGGA